MRMTRAWTAVSGPLLLVTALIAASGTADARKPTRLTVDSHVDIPSDYMRQTRYDVGTDSVLQVDLGKMEQGGLDAAFFVVYVEQGALSGEGYARAIELAERKYSAIELMLQRNPDRIRLATTPAQVLENHAAGRLSAMIGIENGYSLGHDLQRLDAAHARGARYLGLVHAGDNDICTSSAPNAELGEPASGEPGLSEFGRAVVRRASRLGIMVDVSHASDACVRDVLDVSAAPIIASHSSARALVGHSRNLPDTLLRAIAEGGGVIQAVAYREFVRSDPGRAAAEAQLKQQVAAAVGASHFDSEAHEALPAYAEGMRRIQLQFPLATLEDYLGHVQYMVGVAGIDHVGIASDFDGGGGVTGWMDASQTGNVATGLRARGFSEDDIHRLWGGNLLRVWTAAERAGRFDSAIDEVVARYDLPGIAVGVIEDGKVVYAGTRGERVAGSGDAVTPRTLFKIASNSKAMTSSVLARLVDAGKLRWDDPVIRHLPAFRMHDPWVTREMQVGDLLVHNSGLPEGGGDLMLWPEPNLFTRGDIIAGLAHIKPAYSFRSGYAYDNLLYVVAGEVAAAAGGASYEELVRRELFQPLGLTRCRVGEWSLADVVDVAQPHMRKGGRNVVVRADPATVPAITSAAAGGIRCSLDDMLQWAGNWLAPDAGQLAWLSQEQRAAVWKPRTPMPIPARRRAWDDTHFYAYGYGWRLTDVDGVWSVSHTGTLSGMYSVMTLLPDLRTGFVVLINGEGGAARTVLNQILVKHYTSPGQVRTVASYADELAGTPATRDAVTSPAPRRLTVAMDEIAPWLGVYSDPWFGEVSVCPGLSGSARWVAAKSPMLAGTVMRMGDRLFVDWDHDSVDLEAWLDFATGTAGQGATLVMAKVDPEGDFSFDYEDLAFTRIRSCE